MRYDFLLAFCQHMSCLVFPCLKFNTSLETSHIFVNSDIWNRSIRKLSSEFMLVFLVGSPFSMCIIQTYRMLQ